MMKRITSSTHWSTFLMLLAGVGVAIAARLLPHPPNFTPMAALGLFAGAIMLRPTMAAVAMVSAMLISDCFLGFHPMMPVVYSCLLVNVLVGSRWIGGALKSADTTITNRVMRIVSGSVASSVIFFLVTNLACFYAFYPMSMTGLSACYAAALPFFQNSLAGDLFFTSVVFGAYGVAQSYNASQGELAYSQVSR